MKQDDTDLIRLWLLFGGIVLFLLWVWLTQ